ncbi:hypothetical protein CAAN1_06S00188 [[Candida] anglica]|uniref:Uncharacterized protein n=1 Tax=[Candida] anglica TaxID=148631 RepID=A0ABP0ELP4_9ASCO
MRVELWTSNHHIFRVKLTLLVTTTLSTLPKIFHLMNSSSPHVCSHSHGRVSEAVANQNVFAPKPSEGAPNGQHHYGFAKQVSYSDIQSPSFRHAHIISPSKQAPDGYVCVGRIAPQSEHKHPSSSPTKNGIFVLGDNSNLPSPSEFPPSFNPRVAANMPAKEKVSNWIHTVPVVVLEDSFTTLSTCYPGIVSSRESTGDDSMDYAELQDILELQARKITRYVTHIYQNETETVAHQEVSDIEVDQVDINEEIMQLGNLT